MEMPAFLYVVAGLAVLVGLWVMVVYNILVRLRQQCQEAWSNIDTELKRRYELIPNLVETVRGYAKHEQQTLTAVVEARSRAVASTGSPASQAKDENVLVASLRQLLAVSEKYPELKASSNFLALQHELVNTEDRIQAARRFYNGNIRDLNSRVSMFPSNIVASMFGFRMQEFFEIENVAMREAPKVAV